MTNLSVPTKALSTLSVITISLLILTLLTFSLRGKLGNPNIGNLNNVSWREDGPFETSKDRAAFALTYSLLEDHSFQLNVPLAQFSTPDLGYIHNQYVSLLPPGLSLAIIPGYLIGKTFNLSQIGSFLIIAIAATLNSLLIRSIALRLKASPAAATLSGLIFLFATPAFTYAVSLYQHHFSTLFILSAILLLLNFRGFYSLAAIWFLTGISFLFDYPNLLLMLPTALTALGKMINFSFDFRKQLNITIHWLRFPSLATIILPLSALLYFNSLSYHNPYQLSGTLTQIKSITSTGQPDTTDLPINESGAPDGKTAPGFFLTRNLLNGFYIHLVSPDRGLIIYAPILIFGFLGLYLYYKDDPHFTKVFPAIIGINILLYAMWHDPWGGWAFGSRYLIPSYALLAIFIGPFITRFRRDLSIILPFFLLLVYSIYVNTLGAITTSRNPPQTEVLKLESITHQVEKYTFARNFDYLNSTGNKSFIYNTYLNSFLTPPQYYLLLTLLISSLATFFLVRTITVSEDNESK